MAHSCHFSFKIEILNFNKERRYRFHFLNSNINLPVSCYDKQYIQPYDAGIYLQKFTCPLVNIL